MAQVRVVQVPIQGIQIGTIGAALNGQAVSPGIGIQLGKFNNTTGTFYRDPTNASGGGAGQQIQVGTNISNRTLGYIVGTGTTATTTIATQALPGAGYFSIWNNGNVQQTAISIQVPNCTGQQAKAQGSISNQPALNQPLNQQASNYYAGVQQAAVNQPAVQQAAVNQPAVQQAAVQQGATNQPKNQQAANYYAGSSQPLNQQFAIYYGGAYFPSYYAPGVYHPAIYQPPTYDFPDSRYSPGGYFPAYYTPAHYYPSQYQAPNYYAGNSQPLNQQAANYYAGNSQPLVNQPATNQAAVNQAAVNQPASYYAGNSQPLTNQPLVQTPATNQAATGALYNGSLVNPGQIASQGFALYIPNIGTLTTQGGVLQGTGAGGGFQAPGTYIRTASSAVNTQQGIVNFQGTAHN